jgi:ATP-dependent DNA ligase
LIDGEIVISDDDGRADFGALQARLTVARSHMERAASERSAMLIVFDVLELGGCSRVDEPLRERRRRLERLLDGLHPCLQLIEQTSDIALARDSLTLLPTIDSIVAKRVDGTGPVAVTCGRK